jgi:hypothetical protein
MAMPVKTITVGTTWVQVDSGVVGQDVLLMPAAAIYIANVEDADTSGLTNCAQWPASVPWGVNDLRGELSREAVWIRAVTGTAAVGVFQRGVNAPS